MYRAIVLIASVHETERQNGSFNW